MDDFDASAQPDPDSGDNTVALFLGLYLVVLAFFILLVTISTLEETKTRRVMNSLSSTFTTLIPPTADLQAFQAKDGDVLAGQQFQQQVTGIFATAMQVTKVEIVQPGRIMRMSMAANSLFFDGQAKIRPAVLPLLDRTVAALSARPPGVRFDMEFVIDTPYAGANKTMPITETLPSARAGAFAREMLSRGAPPDSIAVGMKPSTGNDVTIWFYTRDIAASRLKFPVQKKDAKKP
ncbi:flagellar motor protein MotB [Varunaivibrio sulfuroxidans]|uniref:Flagellar motor protein MotB n=1 Tax=Varunaivibrio sulfuroxidans TaxID=1773489 RepID=A0A4R3JBL0_9PROT|nr:flagellar motor protein MotB [Varunaivibrio sulfuroxidans]TCS63024.1 flagellar motor protein MotB [Varunaivibrio sulfuroxidans]WES31900.1 flagellar motor protein MotB [Varunaivibrio sulfuroxidans]